ncbi:uncharacterized protein FN964_001933 isoform 3-T3 [Alca torda]
MTPYSAERCYVLPGNAPPPARAGASLSPPPTRGGGRRGDTRRCGTGQVGRGGPEVVCLVWRSDVVKVEITLQGLRSPLPDLKAFPVSSFVGWRLPLFSTSRLGQALTTLLAEGIMGKGLPWLPSVF